MAIPPTSPAHERQRHENQGRSAAQIKTLFQRLCAPLTEPASSTRKAGDNLARPLVARIGEERAAIAFTSTLPAGTFEQAEARLTLVLDYGNSEPACEPVSVVAEEPEPAITPAIGKRQAILDQPQAGALPTAPDFSKPIHARFHAKRAQVVTSAEARNIRELQAFEIDPVSSSPKAMARYRDLCVIAITARTQVAA